MIGDNVCYNERLNPSTKLYIDDYLHLLKNEIMGNGEINELARKIYKNHKSILDVLFDYKQDSISLVRTFFEKKIEEQGWILGTKGRGFIRFLTKPLDDIIPKRKAEGWRNNESFLFEINYVLKQKTKLVFYWTISPGDEEAREKLRPILDDTSENHIDHNSKWHTYHNKVRNFKVEDWALKDPQEIIKFIDDLFEKEIKPNVLLVEKKILLHKEELIKIKNTEL
ncbi:MAG: hypothetical protein DRJ01_15270 [Bacteroidetes bacterium]|nr:MAG: hypothetical protein DRJ01_15270 [Bacteroidota bacterium]